MDNTRDFTKKFSPIARSTLAKELFRNRKDSEAVSRLLSDFHRRFESQEIQFRQENDIRSVENISQNYDVLIVHTIPINGRSGITGMNSWLENSEFLTREERLDILFQKKPTVSCSSVRRNRHERKVSDFPEEYTEKDHTSFYPCGVVIGSGTVLSAHNRDAGTRSLSWTARERKYDKNEPDTSIQPKIQAQIEHAITGPFPPDKMKSFLSQHGHIDNGGGGHGQKYNEFTIFNPEITGFYLDLDALEYDCTVHAGPEYLYAEEDRQSLNKRYADTIKILRHLVGKYQLPLFVKKDGVIGEGTRDIDWDKFHG